MFNYQKATEASYEAIAQLMHQTLADMPIKEWFVVDDIDYIVEGLKSGDLQSILAMDGDTIAAVFVSEVPRLLEDNLGVPAGLEASELDTVVHMDTVVVRPEYRGHGLQKTLMLEGEAMLKAQGYHHLLCTVHPENTYSYRNIASLGYTFLGVKTLYGGYTRALFIKTV